MPCPSSKACRKLLKDAKVIPLRERPEMKSARIALLASLIAYCEKRCGGCAVRKE